MVALRFERHGVDDGRFQRPGARRRAAQDPAQIHRVLVAQAQQQAPLGGHAHPIAQVAEVVTVRRNKADAARAVGHGVQARGAGAARRLAQRRQRVARVDLCAQPVAASQRQGAIVLLNPTQRHLLDKGEIDAPGAGKFHQIQRLVVVAPAQDERIQAQARKARGRIRARD